MRNGEETFLHFEILQSIWRFNGTMDSAVLKYDGEKQVAIQRLDINFMEAPEDNILFFTPGLIKRMYQWLESRGAFDG